MPTRLLQFGSVQGPGVPTQTPSWHVSVVQASPSLHGAVLLVWRQPPAPSQVSSVQGLLSSQFWVVVAVHVPPWQVSPIVQGLASSQGAMLFTLMQPLTGSQPSSVQGLPSSQVGAASCGAVVVGVRVAVVAECVGYAGAAVAGVAGRAGVAVVAGRGVVHVEAAEHRVAAVVGAGVAVVAADRAPAETEAAQAGLAAGAGVAVLTGATVRKRRTGAEAVLAGVGDAAAAAVVAARAGDGGP